jgi:hypothetical protein
VHVDAYTVRAQPCCLPMSLKLARRMTTVRAAAGSWIWWHCRLQCLTLWQLWLQQYKGQNMRVEVLDTKGAVVGAAVCQVSGGDVAFEINHPGG